MYQKVAIVILNWNGKHFLEKFLPTVIECSLNTSIIVADNQSTDESVVFLKNNFPMVTIIQNHSNDGFAKGYNDALKHVKSEYYVLLNSDVEVTPNWIKPVITFMDENKHVAACQPKILDFNAKNKFEYAGAAGGFIDKYGYPLCRGRLFNTLEEDQGQYDDVAEVFWATGACMFVRSSAFWSVGGFDNDYFAHMEEIDLCWRLKNTAHSVFVIPQSVVYHVGGGTLNKINPKKTYLNFRNNLMTYTKNASSQFLFFKIVYRMVLDGVAGAKFLFEGKPDHFFAVIKAHFAYYASLSATLKKRKAMKQKNNFNHTTSGILKLNSVFRYFIKGQKTYYKLNH